MLGDDEVVHHHRGGDVEHRLMHERTGGVDDVVADDRFEHRVGEEEHLAGAGVEAGVGGHGTAQPSVEGVLADGVELGGDLGGQTTLPERQVLAGMADDVGVGGVLHRTGVADQRGVGHVHDIAQAGIHRPTETDLGAQPPGADPTVAIRGGAVGELDAVQHAVAVEHVVATDGVEHGVRAVAHERTAQTRRERAGDAESGDVVLGGDGEQVAGEIGLVIDGDDMSGVEIGLAHDAPPRCRERRG